MNPIERRSGHRIALVSLAVVAASFIGGCGSIGGDDDGGLSAVEILAGGGSWQSSSEGSAAQASLDAVVSMQVQGGAGDSFTGSNGTLTLNLELLDEQGRPIGGDLAPENFTVRLADTQIVSAVGSVPSGVSVVDAEVTEVSVKPPTAAGLTGALLFDSSGSTATTDRERRREDAAVAFVEGMPAGTQLTVLDFGVSRGGIFGRRVVSEGLSDSRLLSDFSSDPASLIEAIARVTSSGGTPMYGALGDALKILESVHDRGAQDLFLIVFTDGEAGDYSSSRANSVIDRANAMEMPIHTVALTGGDVEDQVNLAKLQRLSSSTQGLSLTAFEPAELVRHFQQLTGAVDSRVSIRVDLKFSGSVPTGTYRVTGILDASVYGGSASAPFDVVLGVQ
jgi:hypothetical protein